MTETFDYIVVGAGSAGAVVAARLSEDPNCRVLLLEAGGKDLSPWIHVPGGYYRTIYNPKLTWQFETEPQQELACRRIRWPRGRVLGGSSSINGLVYVRGQWQDFDHWASLGNPGWAASDGLPYFLRAENQERGGGAYHGIDGPLGVSDIRDRRPICDAFVQAGEDLGINRTDDFNGEQQEGVGLYQLTVLDGWRSSTATSYLRKARHRPNLVVRTKCLLYRLEIENRRVVGVRFQGEKGNDERAVATSEVVLSCGTVGSPVVLQRSGIGPAAVLKAAGVIPVVDLPGVGSNLSDRLQIRSIFRCRGVETLNDVYHSWFKRVASAIQFMRYRTGPLAVGAGQAAAFLRSQPDLETPDLEIIFMAFSVDGPGGKPHRFPGCTILGYPLRPRSRGSISITSADHRAPPTIQPNYLTDAYDREMMIATLRTCRSFAEQPSLRRHIVAETKPGPEVQSDEEMLEYIRSEATTVFHPVGSCRMGPDPSASDVVDANLRVHGVAGLRVIDASIMPTIVSGNTNAATIMIGEKGADMIIQERRKAS